ncbi:protoheme IX farnesyltransferase [Nordella sp. HKS 07]|uniref:heme o synthase n=1 Tax=Nordella sp. HKS 07 TaxID=2712222 RepID=UPI0013E1DD4D|nr:heme o synthase [Nordella sp. HKS 07]QIG49166.1 protoheme IX farnesyltransferase [Nordella sp. HKS 07]
MSDIHADISDKSAATLGGQGTVRDYWALLKPRVMSLVIFTALAGLVAAPGDIHPWLALVALLAIAVGAGASGALNMWYDADIDALMARTANRPVPRGAILPGEALGFGLALAIGSVLVLGLLVNIVAAALLAFTIFFYAVIYTMWLKRSTPQNIVIGGAAGAFPPMIGWAAATGSVSLASIALFLIIFMWTPPHFWALALFREGDYARAGVPMMPNVAGAAETRKQILLYSLILVPITFLPALLGTTGLLYTAVTAILGLAFIWHAIDVYRLREGDPARRACRRLFGFSILYLFALFALVIAERILGVASFAPVIG